MAQTDRYRKSARSLVAEQDGATARHGCGSGNGPGFSATIFFKNGREMSDFETIIICH
jgi:hypothetical protein